MTRAPLALAFILAASLCLPVASHGQPYPGKPLRLVVPFAAGGGIDVLSRALGAKLSERLGQPVVVDNRPASNGVLGAELVARSAPDGYTLMPGGSWHVVGSLMYKNLPYNVLRDYTPVMLFADTPIQILVHGSVPVNTIEELIAYSKANPRQLNYGSPGFGHPFHLAMELFKRRTGAVVEHVAYKGGGPAAQDFIAGRVQAIFYTTTATLLEHIKAGKVRALATATPARIASLPGVPTLLERGIDGVVPAANLAFVGPAGIPPAITQRLQAEITQAMATPEVTKTYDALLLIKAPAPAEEYRAIMARELETWGPIVKSLNITLD